MLGLAILSVLLLTLCAATDIVVKTKNGRLRGVRTELSGKYVDTYKGIPYALPPTGARRFKTPSPAAPWSGVRDATNFRSPCPQTSKQYISHIEDCLYLNVYSTAKNMTTPPLPVMMYIHGGAYARESASNARYDATWLARNSVVIVTINYRLGALGFLSTEDQASPGNYGMMDQLLALKWVKQNIADFGGDPHRVTLFGQSAGSASVSLHLLSPLSKGLFRAAIMESGVSLAAWAVKTYNDNPSPLDQAKILGHSVGCSQTNTSKLIECLRKVSVPNLVTAQAKVKNAPPRLAWSPVVDTITGFLPETPQTLINKGKQLDIPTIRGVNKDEFALLLTNIQGISQGVSLQEAKAQIHIIVQDRFHSNQQAIRTAIEGVYLKDVDPSDHVAIRTRLIEALESYTACSMKIAWKRVHHGKQMVWTDVVYYIPSLRESEIQSSKHSSPTYMYEFDYRSPKSTFPSWQGVPHTAELDYVFGKPFLNESQWAPFDKTVSTRMMGYVTNFAKHGNPSYGGVTWRPFTVNHKYYLDINRSSVMKTNARSLEEKLWLETLPKLANMKNPILLG